MTLPANGTTTSTDGRASLAGLSPSPDTAARLSRLALAAIGVLAALNFAWQLGSSSYYVDEVVSVNTSLSPFGHLLHAVSTLEVSPPAYYALLHEWLLRAGSGHEWVARLPSAIGAVLLVGAVYWLCSLLDMRRATRLAAATLASVSPFVLQLAQLAEPYVFAALACVVAVGAALKADREPPIRARWIALSLAAALIALCVHYTAILVIGPLCAWAAIRPSTPRRWRLAYPLACAACELALLPLVVAQLHAHPGRPGVAVSGAISSSSVKRMLEVPFTGRVQTLQALGIAVMLAAVAVVLVVSVRRATAARRFVVALAIVEPFCLFILSALGGRHFWGHLMLARYAAVAVPFLIVALALAFEAVPLKAALALGGCAAAVAVAGTLDSHRTSGFYLDARGAVAYLQRHARAGDAVLATSDPVAQVPLTYYGIDRLHPRWLGGVNAAALERATRGRTWVIAAEPTGHTPTSAAALADESVLLRPAGERPLAARVFPGNPGLLVTLIAPAARRNMAPR